MKHGFLLPAIIALACILTGICFCRCSGKLNTKSSPDTASVKIQVASANPTGKDDNGEKWTTILSSSPVATRFRNEWTFEYCQIPTMDGRRQIGAQDAFDGGAASMMTIRIVDTSGNAISGVKVSVCPYVNWTREKTLKFVTDETGVAVLSHAKASKYDVFATKEGYYDANVSFVFYSNNHICVENGRWIPWNPHVDIVMKSIGDYVDLFHFRSWDYMRTMPVGSDIAFDMFMGDFLPPYGSGNSTDVLFRVEGNALRSGERHSVTKLSFPHGGGVRKECVDGFSTYVYPREIAEGHFSSILEISKQITANKSRIIDGALIPGVEFYAMKLPVMGKNGTNDFHYGVIVVGPIGDVLVDSPEKAHLAIEYYVNPEPGNPVIESAQLLKK